MIFLNFKEWQEQQAEHYAAANPKIECPSCEGEGVVYDECGCCGHETEENCDDCGSSGRVKFNDINKFSRGLVFTKDKYLSAIHEEFTKYAAFTSKDVASLFFKCGFVAYCSINNKKILLNKQ